MQNIKSYFQEASEILSQFNSNDENFEKIRAASELIINCFHNGGKVISCGNGGSMSDAMHFAEELTGRFREDRPSLPAISISDPTHITCVGNDYGFEFIFSRFIDGIGKKEDVILVISTSGNSINILNAITSAKNKGMKIIALTGKDGGKCGPMADIEIRAPKTQFADHVQEIHIKIIHSLILDIEAGMKF